MIINVKLENEKTELCNIMNKHGSDKGSGHHNYTKYYYNLFKEMRFDKKNIFELGLGTNNPSIPSNMGIYGKPGASLRGWREFFSNSNIFGADIDKDILFNEEKIQTFFCDQTSPESIKHLWNNLPVDEIDILIEDGLHTFEANICFFENSFKKVKKGGYYIIEDVYLLDVQKYKEFMNNTNIIFNKCNILNIFNEQNTSDNVLIVIQK